MTFPPVVLQIILVLLVVPAAVYDLRFRRIPNWLVLAGLLLGLGLNSFLFEWTGLRASLLGLGVGLLVYFPLYMLRGMGAGDVKLMAAVGSIVGWADWLGIFFLTALIGGVAAIALLVSRQQLARGLSNVGYLLVEILCLRPPYARKEELDLGSPKSVKLPHGVVIAWGSVLFLGAAWIWAPR
ncbi:MAG: prepilin peptidase [Acidobacteriia bacterium]|nr:prepilin peptidase [Terriglobia bacterium]